MVARIPFQDSYKSSKIRLITYRKPLHPYITTKSWIPKTFSIFTKLSSVRFSVPLTIFEICCGQAAFLGYIEALKDYIGWFFDKKYNLFYIM